MDNQEDFPYYFDSHACQTCSGTCCRGFGGYVWIRIEELEIIAGTRKMDVAAFAGQYIRQVQGRLSLQERVINGEHFCCFFDPMDARCTIYQNRPQQCRTFPFWDRYKKAPHALLAECPGVALK